MISSRRYLRFVPLILSASLLFTIRGSSPVPAGSTLWERWDEGLPRIAPVLTLAAAPKQPERIYAGTYSLPGLWQSTDGGKTWGQVGQSETEGPEAQAANAILWDSVRQRWWVGTANGLFFRLADSPRWQSVAELAGSIFSLALDEQGHLYAVQADEGLFRWEKDGSWTRLHREPQALVIDISPTGQHLFLGTAGHGLWISLDGGNSWRQVERFPEDYVSTLLVDSGADRWVYAGTSQQLYRSGDGGGTWQPVPELAERVYALRQAPNGTLYAGLEGRVAWSRDEGQSWAFSGNGLHPHMPVFDLIASRQTLAKHLLLAATRDGLYRSPDRGQS